MNLTILSPTTRRDVQIQWIDVKTTEGGYVILPGHAPFIAQLATDEQISFSCDGNVTESIPIIQGLLKVDRKQVTIIIDE